MFISILAIYLGSILDGLAYGVSLLLFNSDNMGEIFLAFSPTLTMASGQKRSLEEDSSDVGEPSSKRAGVKDSNSEEQGSPNPSSEGSLSSDEEGGNTPPHGYDSPVFDANVDTSEEYNNVHDKASRIKSLMDIAVRSEDGQPLNPVDNAAYEDARRPASEQLSRDLDAEQRTLRILERTITRRKETGVVSPQPSRETSPVTTSNVDSDPEDFSTYIDENSLFLPVGLPILQIISLVYM
jgi:hypothetical protein